MAVIRTIRSGLFCTSLLLAHSLSAEEQSFRQYADSINQEAIQLGVTEQTISIIEEKLKYFRKKVINNNADSSSEVHFEDFLTKSLADEKVDKLLNLFITYHQQLTEIGEHYQVQPRFILALWGELSNAGTSLDSFSVLSVMLSKAFISQSDFDRNQYLAAAEALNRNMVSIEELNSDHNGLMGQLKISPKFFEKYGQDWDSDGKFDIWHNKLDSFATIAYFLQQSGWDNSLTWGRQVKIKSNLTEPKDSYLGTKSFAQWGKLGVTKFTGSPLPNRPDVLATFLTPANTKDRHFLIYKNYKIIKTWPNFDDYKSLSVLFLSERLNASIKKWRSKQQLQTET
ncbi:lytic murein transglycosylase [Parashewanella spongiae]|nr:lytic murein transglycosylase [Parashewanella spongiae]MCL1077238.1 lytic murein transglycosylase [Parashewanella spongiae]